jgi:hypothetical protein
MPLVCLASLAACGRLGFEPRVSADASGDADRDATLGDGQPSTIALVQIGMVLSSSNGLTLTLPAPSTAGTLLVATFGDNSIVQLNLPPPWQLAAASPSSGTGYAILAYQANNPGGITSVTFMQTSGIPLAGLLSEWSGVATTSPLDAMGSTMSASPVTSQSVQTSTVPTVAGELAIAVFSQDANVPSYTTGTGWTNVGGFGNLASAPSFTADYQLGVPMAVVGETVTSSVAGKYGAIVVTFLPQ